MKQILHDLNDLPLNFVHRPACRQNEVLWREVVSLRQNHTQQQKVMNKVSGHYTPVTELPASRKHDPPARTLIELQLIGFGSSFNPCLS